MLFHECVVCVFLVLIKYPSFFFLLLLSLHLSVPFTSKFAISFDDKPFFGCKIYCKCMRAARLRVCM